jgi:hypothetical protein
MERLSSAIVIATLVACWGAPPPSPAPTPSGRPNGETLEQARAFERGAGVPRDYRRSAAIYARLCADGGGSLEACHELVDAIMEGRGVTLDRRRVMILEAALCQRGYVTACVVSTMFGERGPAAEAKLAVAFERAQQACAKPDGRACLLLADLRGGDGSTAENDRREKYGAACRAGLVEGCRHVAFEFGMCGDAVEDAAACEARTVTEWRANSYDADRVDAADRLQRACTAGDARACKHLPSRRLPDAELCAAHDYGACADLGCIGDDAAEKVARDHGVTDPNCHVAGTHAYMAWRRKPVGLPPIVSERRRPIGARSTPPFDAIRVTHHGGRDRKGWPRYDVYNINDQTLLELVACAYAYDENGNQVARAELSLAEVPIAPDAVASVEIARGSGTIPEVTAAAVTFEISYQRVRFGSAAPAIDATRCPAQRPPGSQQVYGW